MKVKLFWFRVKFNQNMVLGYTLCLMGTSGSVFIPSFLVENALETESNWIICWFLKKFEYQCVTLEILRTTKLTLFVICSLKLPETSQLNCRWHGHGDIIYILSVTFLQNYEVRFQMFHNTNLIKDFERTSHYNSWKLSVDIFAT